MHGDKELGSLALPAASTKISPSMSSAGRMGTEFLTSPLAVWRGLRVVPLLDLA